MYKRQIIIPKGFHAKKAVMKLTAGNILVSGLSADNTKVEVGMGKCEIKNMYSQHLNMKCGMGDIVGSCSMNGDVNVCLLYTSSGLISAFYDDIDMDFDNELITVESSGVSVYQGSENGVTFLGSIDTDLIANYGNCLLYTSRCV